MRRVAVLLAALATAACAPLPPAPSPPAPPAVRAPGASQAAEPSSPREAAVVRHKRLARAAQEAGALDEAAEHYAVLAMLEPTNPAHKEAARAMRAAIDDRVREQLRIAAAARRDGNVARAREAWLRVLVLDPGNTEAAKGLRELEQQSMARTQADRAARARSMDEIVASARARAAGDAVANSADLEQRLELVRSSDASIALREARAWAEQNPNDRAGRQRLASGLHERGRELEAKGQREWALPLFDQAASLGGPAQADAAKRASALRKSLADEAYADGMRARNADLALAIRYWETALRYDPQHARAKERLREARAVQQKLERIAK